MVMVASLARYGYGSEGFCIVDLSMSLYTFHYQPGHDSFHDYEIGYAYGYR